MNSHLKVAVIGLGNMGRHHVKHLSTIPGVTLGGVCDLRVDVAQEFGRTHQCGAYTDVTQMLEELRPEMVSIIAPTSLHFALAEQCLQAGAHVFIEKPIAATVSEADALIRLAAQVNRQLTVGHIERFNPTFTALTAQISKLGKIVSIHTRRVSPMPTQIQDANVLVDIAVHDIDLCNALMTAAPTQVHGKGTRSVLSDRDDAATLFLTYPGGSACVEVNWLSPIRVRELTVTGSQGWAKADLLHHQLSIWTHDRAEPEMIVIPEGDALALELGHFIACIREHRTPLVSGTAARDVLAVAQSSAIES